MDSSTLETQAYREQLTNDHRVDIDVIRTASDALQAKSTFYKYPVIVVNPWLAPGEGYVLPGGWQGEHYDVGLNFIQRVREYSPATLIVPVVIGSKRVADKVDSDLIWMAGCISKSAIPLLDYLPSDFSKMMKPYFIGSSD